MQNRPTDPIIVLEVVEASSEPFELLDKDLVINFDLDSISAWFYLIRRTTLHLSVAPPMPCQAMFKISLRWQMRARNIDAISS
jgi:hypothetical protein